ncbi:MAG: hypothetical protein ABJN36_17550 [Cyclobacteriaceae bacterium]
MARQKGIIKLEGTIGDVSFYKSKDGYLAREKGGVDADRIKNDPAFARTRENGSEFGRAGKAGKLIRTAFRPLLLKTSDSKVTSRLTKQLMAVLQSDVDNPRGERKVDNGNLELIQGFDFNSEGRLEATLYAPYDVTFDRAAGSASIDIPEFIPANSLAYPQGATHLKMVAAVSEVNFDNDEFTYNMVESAEVEITNVATGPLKLDLAFNADSEELLLIVFGIDFYQSVNGQMYAMKNGGYNCLALVEVDKFVQVQQN